jgi:DNA polymerase-3 subunit epsilon
LFALRHVRYSRSVQPLSDLDVLVVDCQATAAHPHGHLLELGWTRTPSTGAAQALLINLPDNQRIPPAVARLTGISDNMARRGVDPQSAWRELLADARTSGQQPAPTVVHFARFEQPFFRSLAGGAPPLDIVCTHDIARRLLPDLPRCSLRALAGYFGRSVGVLRRSAGHVEATAFVWTELVRMLEDEGLTTWGALREWLAQPMSRHSERAWPLPRAVRLSLPDAPGVYRLLRTSGDVLYVGKASSLHQRVNSHFRKRHGLPERTLEMMSQVRALSFQMTPSALEAALLEPDEIKRLRPPYNVALTDDRQIWFAARDLSERSPLATHQCPLGPFPSARMLDEFSALARGSRTALGRGRGAPDEETFDAGYARLRTAHGEMSCDNIGPHRRLLRLGARLWSEGRRDDEPQEDVSTGRPSTWTPELVQFSLERLALRGALARRRARWLTHLVDAAVAWCEPGADRPRLLIIENGEITSCAPAVEVAPPIPPGYRRPPGCRRDGFTLARFDRLRVLTTELKRLLSEGAPAAVRFGAAPALMGARLARVLSWV